MAAVTASAPPALPAWEERLAAQRGTLNGIVSAARSAGAPVDVLWTAMREVGSALEPLLRVVSPAQGDVVCRVVTELVGDLVVRRAWHGRSAERWAVLSLLPHLPCAMGRSPRTAIEVVVQGAGRISRETDLVAWGARLAAADAFLADDDALRAGAAVAAWRSGLVRVRSSALTAARGLDPAPGGLPDGRATSALRALLDLPTDVDPRAVLAANVAAPFAWPGVPRQGAFATYGGYRAFGGPWTGLPVVVGALGSPTPTWRVLADGIAWVVIADVHGHVVLREHTGPGEPPPVPADSSGVVGDTVRDIAGEIAQAVAWEDVVTGAVPAAHQPGPAAPTTSAARQHAARPVLVSRATSCRLDLVLVPSVGERTGHELS
ncbi:hypothetical protein [Sanguibacter antarcticus]|uniref:Uncharacterized protein n=1 Tax=Sanguibacter antarcticus TaxID=372484 RepID=A0A2A9E8R7_9MICO|nr:hypothetical protein [Sanguibacter antarcticus]PFG35223.1 hypothetical protein ATL42_3162 [Sanguibacter antarcticus]